MSPQLTLLFVLSIVNCGLSANIGPVNSGRSEPRISSPIISSGSVSSNINDGDSNNNLIGSKSQEPVVGPVVGVYGGYTGTPGQNTGANGYVQPAAFNGYVYNNGNPYPGNQNPVFGVSSNGDLTLSAYFGPVFWGVVSGLVVVLLIIWLINLFGGFQLLGGAIRNIGIEKSISSKAKSLDFDKLTVLVHTALDKYNHWNNNQQDKQ